MNTFNRIVMLIVALLLAAVPALALLAVLGVIPSQAASSAVSPLGSVPGAISGAAGAAGPVTATASVLVGLIALFLIFRELKPRPGAAKHVYLQDESRRHTRLSASATKSLVSGAAREAGALSPSVSMSSRKRRHTVYCKVQADPEADLAGLAGAARQNIEQVLGEQSVPYRNVEVTVVGHASTEESRPPRTDSARGGSPSSGTKVGA